MLLWVTAGLALLLAMIAYGSARRTRRKLESLNHSYWELRYEHSTLRAQVARLDPEQQREELPAPASSGPPVGFVPLAALKPGAKPHG